MSQATTFSSRAFWKRLTNLDGEEMEKAWESWETVSTVINQLFDQPETCCFHRKAKQPESSGWSLGCLYCWLLLSWGAKKNGACSGSFFSRTSKTRPWESLGAPIGFDVDYGHLLSSNIYYHLLIFIICYYHLLTIWLFRIVWVDRWWVLCFHPSSCGMWAACRPWRRRWICLWVGCQIYAATDASHSEEKRRMYSLSKMNRYESLKIRSIVYIVL